MENNDIKWKIVTEINLRHKGTIEEGVLSFCEESELPFLIKRAYWITGVANNINRGFHAHKELSQLLLAVSGTISITIEDGLGSCYKYTLCQPWQGLFIPPGYWREFSFSSESATLLCLASHEYDESDYIRDKNSFFIWKRGGKNA